MEKTCVIYARQSFTANEEQSVSIEVQIENCRRWAEKNGVSVIGVFSDANVSSECFPLCQSGIENAKVDKGYQHWRAEQRTTGRKEYKEGLGKAFDLIVERKPTYIVVNTSNRLGRSATNSNLHNYMTAFFMENRCSVVDVSAGSVTDFSDRLMLAFRAMKDAIDYQGLYEKRKSSMESVERRINSYTKWSNAFGVKMVGGQVTFDRERTEALQFIFGKIVNGASYPSILKVLNTKYRHLTRGKQWYQTNLNSILKNPIYCGYMYDRQGVLDRAKNIPNVVISYSVWQEAQKVIVEKKSNGGKYNVSGHKRAHWLPLSGYVRCECGRRMLVRMDDGKIVYQCGSPDHTRRLYITDGDLATIQKIFIIGLLDDSRRISELAKVSDRVDGLKATVERLQGSLRAKMTLVESEDDAIVYKPVLDKIKSEIAEAKKALLEAQNVESADTKAMQDRLERNFSAIMEGKLLDEETYQRLLQATINYIEVRDDSITVVCKCGVSFSLPRLEGKHHAKRLLRCSLLCDSEGEEINQIRHYQLHFYDGEDSQIIGGETIYEDDTLSVWIHR